MNVVAVEFRTVDKSGFLVVVFNFLNILKFFYGEAIKGMVFIEFKIVEFMVSFFCLSCAFVDQMNGFVVLLDVID